MRLATTVSVALIALSTAALAQVADPASPQLGNNVAEAPAANASDVVDPAQNMLSDSASPPPTEPK
ncbi:hypothetical protein [Sphingomonas jeddahensis]|uniref:Uncharacterized protein n=1 Tax=Sphingomonas jeddahensis TaxID=1915074 RepID=A0A1V2ETP2_9SPHN|nr:hypothetical protein [Sphingomonas jeddahensis]ONF95539.1 hypothetical protein SPHI_22060 [Sphingomonas jeddahensis]